MRLNRRSWSQPTARLKEPQGPEAAAFSRNTRAMRLAGTATVVILHERDPWFQLSGVDVDLLLKKSSPFGARKT
jgi:hypothetical protein